MTLHGDLRVNHRKIGEWWATRQPGTVDVHHYRWAVRVDGADWVHGELAHREADGAAVLAGKVLAASRAIPDAGGLTEDEVAYAIAGVYSESCGWGATRGRECGTCDCLGMTESYARSAARAVLAIARHRLAAAEVAAEGYRQRAERAASARDQLREEARKFAEALGFGDGRTEHAATLAEMVDPLTEAMSDAREHQDCPVTCELCGERLAATTCEACRGSGCLPNAALAYLECGECAGVGKVHAGCVEQPYAALAATLARVRETAEHYDGRTGVDAAAAILRVLDGAS